MKELFLVCLNNAWVVSALILVVICIRQIFKKMQKSVIIMLWAVVGLKMLIPFDIYSPVGLLPNYKTIEYNANENAPVMVHTGIRAFDYQVTNYIGNLNAPVTVDKGIHFIDVCVILWIAGIVFLLLYLLVSYMVMRKKVKQSILVQEGVSICDEIDSPFLLGMIKPHVYLPSGIEKEKYEYILAHEQMHRRRRDQFLKPLAFFLMSIYWFNPLCCFAYFLFCKDIEISCDEMVISKKDASWRANYCETLLECSTGNRKITLLPLAFGEIGVKERIKKIMFYKKSTIGTVVLFVIICGAAILCFGCRQREDATKGVKDKKEQTMHNKREQKGGGENEFIGQTPTVDLDAPSGADGSRIYYADEGKIIFGGSYGLFVYDTKNRKYIQSVDLKPIGCDFTQGEDATIISVNKDGSKVYLHKMSDKENMYIYSVQNNQFEKKKYALNESDLFTGVDEYYEYAKFISEAGVEWNCSLVNSFKNIGALGYKYTNDDEPAELVYPLFVEERLKDVDYFELKDVSDIVRAEIFFDGKHYVCDDKEYLAMIEAGFPNAKKNKGGSGCPYDDVLYLTKADGTIGMVLPAMDSCMACYMADGWYEMDRAQSVAPVMSIYDMIEKNYFYVQDESLK